MIRKFVVLLLGTLIASCAAQPTCPPCPSPEIVEVTRVVVAEVEVDTGDLPEFLQPAPTKMPTEPAEDIPAEDLWALNYVGQVDNGDVSMEVLRVLFADIEALSSALGVTTDSWGEMSNDPEWDNASVIGEFVVRFTNNGDQPVEVGFGHCGDNLAIVEGQQIDFDISIHIGDVVCHDTLYPQAYVDSWIYFPVHNLDAEDIVNVTLVVECPNLPDEYSCLGPDFTISWTFDDHKFEEIPDEIRQ